jgi:hypothetical protein
MKVWNSLLALQGPNASNAPLHMSENHFFRIDYQG